MANPEHLKILEQGVEVWNAWRRQHRDIRPDLTGADLTVALFLNPTLLGAKLTEANLYGANLFLTNFTNANLRQADLSRTNLASADLTGANLSGAVSIETVHDARLSSFVNSVHVFGTRPHTAACRCWSLHF